MKNITVCLLCKKEFSASPSSKKKFCSANCYWQSLQGKASINPGMHQSQKVLLTCEWCSAQFELPPSKANRSKHKFCSSDCMGKFRQHTHKTTTVEEMCQWYVQEHLTIKEIAIKLETTEWVVQRIINEYKLPIQGHVIRGIASWLRSDDSRREQAVRNGKKLSQWPVSIHDRQKNAVIGAKALQEKRGPTNLEHRLMVALDIAGIKYTTQLSIGDKFLCDFAFPEAKLIVECDGEYWHSTAKAKARDSSKDAYLRACGFTVLRFSGTSIKTNINDCVSAIQNHLNTS